MDEQVVMFAKRLRMIIEENVIVGMREIYSDMLLYQVRHMGYNPDSKFNGLIASVGDYLDYVDTIDSLKKEILQRLEGDNGLLNS